MSNFIVCHARKIQTAVGLVNVCSHNTRVNIYADNGAMLQQPDWLTRTDRAHLNEGDMIPPEVILKRRNSVINQAEKETVEAGEKWRKPQKNASAAVEFSLSASPEWFEKKSEREIKNYFDDCRAFLSKRFGTKNMIHWATHWDEKTPHMHVIMTPLVNTENGWKYSSSEFLGGRKGLQELQNDIYTAVGEKNGLQRGVEGSTARHTDQVEYLAQMSKKEKELAQKEKELNAKEKKIESIIQGAQKDIPAFTPQIQKKPIGSFLYSFRLSNGETAKNWDIYEAKETALQAIEYSKKLKTALFESNLRKNEAIEYAQKQGEYKTKYRELVSEVQKLTPEELRKLADQKEQQKTKNRQRDKDSGFER